MPGNSKRGPKRRPPSGGKGAGPRRSGPRQPKAVLYRPSDNARVVSAPESGTDLGHYLQEALPGTWSVRAVRRFLADGKVTVDGQVETFGSRRLKKGNVVDFALPEAEQDIDRFDPKRVAYDDHGLLAYDKPPGLTVTPTESGKQWHLEKLIGDVVGTVYPVHRLDADTSGLVLFARSEPLAEEVRGWFREHQVHKGYQAIVRGHPKEQGERRTYLVVKESQPGFEKWGTGRGPDAREAITTWELVERLGAYASLMKVEPATGRHHQIRIHFSEMGHPLYGDRLYGDRRDPVLATRHMLHADRLRCPHPSGGKPLTIRCRLPKDMQDLAAQLRQLR